jgi:hypothetical protein
VTLTDAQSARIAAWANEPPEGGGPPWRAGDIVGTGEPDDRRAWIFVPDDGDAEMPWLAVDPTDGRWSWVTEREIPSGLVLLVRDGRAAAR